MTRYRLILLVLLGLLLLGIAHEQSLAQELDADCATLCVRGCASEGGCRLFRQVGCNCRYACESGAQGGTVCGG